MINYITLNIEENQTQIDIPLEEKARGLKGFLSLKAAGDMARHKRDRIPDRQNFLDRNNLGAGRFYSLYQKHTLDAVVVDETKSPEVYEQIEADGLVSPKSGVVLGVTVADCLPIWILDKKQGHFGIVHSGWKGTGIILKASNLLMQNFRSFQEDMKVFIGPGIGPCCYNIPEERARYFTDTFGEDSVTRRDGEYFVDLKKANTNLLTDAGITDITVITNCTACTPNLNSFRRDGADNYKLMLAGAGYLPEFGNEEGFVNGR